MLHCICPAETEIDGAQKDLVSNRSRTHFLGEMSGPVEKNVQVGFYKEMFCYLFLKHRIYVFFSCHCCKADPSGLQSRVKNDFKMNSKSIILTQRLCEMSVTLASSLDSRAHNSIPDWVFFRMKPCETGFTFMNDLKIPKCL